VSKSVDDISRRVVRRLLDHIIDGRIEIVEPNGFRTFGQTRFEHPVTARVTVHHPHFYTAFFRGSLGLAESYRDGEWDCDDLTALVRIGARNMPALDRARAIYRVAEQPARRMGEMVHDHTKRRTRTARHYNLGNDLFSRMLDETMAYSSGIFESADTSLEDAQIEKFDRVCRELRLQPGDRVLEIGTGWGGFSMHAAAYYGCKVTTTTISEEQATLARQRIASAALSDRIEVVERDFAELEGEYDKIASIEMIESIGWRRFDEFFEACDRLLSPDGLMCHQIITIDDKAFHAEKLSKIFINTLIFDGGSLPSSAYLNAAIKRHTDMYLAGFEDITEHYPETLRRWRDNFNASRDELRENYDDRFARLWNLYLAYCEAGFIERRIMVGQGLWARPRAKLLPTVSATEHALGGEVQDRARAA
jgi:cyclopropane-fatty-acyl-phospholipid synthase